MLANEEKRLALVRCIEVIGEAGHDVTLTVKEALPQVPWPAMYGMRNRLIHDYGNTNYKVVHDAVTNVLPGLASILASLPNTATRFDERSQNPRHEDRLQASGASGHRIVLRRRIKSVVRSLWSVAFLLAEN